MKTRLDEFMKSKGLSAGRLADMVGVQPSGISHLLAGRNKPGFDFIYKILQRFPDLNPDWLILGIGTMYRSGNGDMEQPRQGNLLTQQPKLAQQEQDLLHKSEDRGIEQSKFVQDKKDILHKSENEIQQPELIRHKQDILRHETDIYDSSALEPQQNKAELNDVNNSKFDCDFKLPMNLSSKENKTIERIVIFFTNNTFKEYLSI